MKKDVIITIASLQRIGGEQPERTKLVTQGTLQIKDDAVELTYAESELTGLEGTTTTFRIEKEQTVLTRSGALESRMVFAVGREEQSLYDMGFGVLMIAVRAEKIESTIGENGGSLSVNYSIAIEDETAGFISYRIDVRPKREKR